MAASPDDCDINKSIGLGMRIVMSTVGAKFSNVKNISTDQLAEWLRNETERDIVLIDSRDEAEYQISHIAGSHRADFKTDDIPGLVKSIPSLTSQGGKKTIVCYCSVGYRSSALAQKLQQYFQSKESTVDIYNLEGSLFKWANENRQMIDMNNQPTRFAHPYNALWGKLLNKELRKSSM